MRVDSSVRNSESLCTRNKLICSNIYRHYDILEHTLMHNTVCPSQKITLREVLFGKITARINCEQF